MFIKGDTQVFLFFNSTYIFGVLHYLDKSSIDWLLIFDQCIMLICLHLVKFKDDNQVPHQSSSKFRSCCSRSISVGEVIGQYILVSSANNPKEIDIVHVRILCKKHLHMIAVYL